MAGSNLHHGQDLLIMEKLMVRIIVYREAKLEYYATSALPVATRLYVVEATVRSMCREPAATTWKIYKVNRQLAFKADDNEMLLELHKLDLKSTVAGGATLRSLHLASEGEIIESEETVFTHLLFIRSTDLKDFHQKKPTSPEFSTHVEAVRFFTKRLGKYTVMALRDARNNTQLHSIISTQNTQSPFQAENASNSDDHQHPAFVSEYMAKLDAKRLMPLDQFEQLQKLFGQDMCETHFGTSMTKKLLPWEFGTYNNILYDTRLPVIRKCSSAFIDSHLTVHLIDPALTVDSLDGSRRYDKNVGWGPVLLPGTFANPNSLYTFKPRSDFCFFDTMYGPLVMGEVISDNDESDRWRMLFEGAAVCRYQNILRGDRMAIILCFYLNKAFKMERYLIYQLTEPADREVHILHDLTLDLTRIQEAYQLSKQLFNFREHSIQTPELDESRKQAFLSVQEKIKEIYDVSMPAARKAESNVSHETTLGTTSRALGSIGDIPVLQTSFTAINLVKPSHKDVAMAIRRSDGQAVVLKRIKSVSSELRILQLLQFYPPHGPTNIIPLLEVVELPRGMSTLVMPRYTSIFDMRQGREEELALQLIRGVEWLHKQLIGHCDIKQRNLVFDERQSCLLIIDFGLAVQLTSRDQKIRGARGTPEHVAPEVGIEVSWENHLKEVSLDEDSVYSPLLADVWAVGDVINYFRGRFPSSIEGVRTAVDNVAKDLQAVIPSKRLSLSDAKTRIMTTCTMTVTRPNPPVPFWDG